MHSNYSIPSRRPLPRRHRRSTLAWVWLLVGVVALFLLALVSCNAYKNSGRTFDTVIENKERVCDTNSCKYLVFTKAGTFRVTDSLGILSCPMRFDSSDIYGRIKKGPATLTTIGWRLPLFSKYPNICAVKQGD